MLFSITKPITQEKQACILCKGRTEDDCMVDGRPLPREKVIYVDFADGVFVERIAAGGPVPLTGSHVFLVYLNRKGSMWSAVI